MKRWQLTLGLLATLLVTVGLAGCGNGKQAATKTYKYGSITIPAKNGTICGPELHRI